MIRFPLALFPPGEHRWAPVGAALVGGTPLSGVPQSADASTGGYWLCEYTPAVLRTHAHFGAWRALLGQLNSGVGLIEVPVVDVLQPWPAGIRPSRAPFGDLTDFSDESLFVTSPISAKLAAQAYMPAWPAPATAPTQAAIEIDAGAALKGGEYFSVIGPSGAVRLHLVTSILSVAGNVSTVTLIPPFREDMAAGTAVDLNTPRCTMKVDLASVKEAWPKVSVPFLAKPTIVFVEGGFVIPPE